MGYKAVVMDLDGTLCTDRKLHMEDKKAIERTLEKGIPVIPATTRMRFSTSMILKDLEIDNHPLICNNGARVISPRWKKEGKYKDWHEINLDHDIAEELISYSDEKDYEITTIFKDKKFWKRSRLQSDNKSELDSVTELVDVNIEALEEGAPISIMMHSEGNGKKGLKDFESYAEDFSKKVRLDRHHRFQEWIALTVYHSDVSKKKALDLVCKKINISVDDVLALGDDEVDTEMLEFAGKGIAMGNSPEYVKQVADEIAPSCKNQGVKWALKKYILGQN